MSSVVKFSEAASLALHTVALLAAWSPRQASVKEVGEALQVSEHHLAKVMQRLQRAGLLTSERGPRGGFRLAGNPDETTLLEVYEAIEGPMMITSCLFAAPRCHGDCLMGHLLADVNWQVKEHLRTTRVTSLADIIRSKNASHPENRPDR